MATVLQGVQQTQAQLVAQGPNATIFMGKETRRFYAQTRYGMCSNLNYLNPRIYQTLTKLTTPELPNTKTYQELVKLLKQHLTPQSSVIAEQHKFALRTQHEGETIANYVAKLRKMTLYCDFKCEHCKKSTINTHLRT